MSPKLFLTLIALAASGALLYNLLPSIDPPKTVDYVDLSRYTGVWYEIASVPIFATEDCVCSSANYSLNADDTIKVVNSCTKDGEIDSIVGKAYAVDDTNSKLKVEFFAPFTGDYWIVGLDEDYRWVLVSNPERSNLWILSRTPQMEQTLYDNLVADLKENNFPVEELVFTSKNCQ